MEHESQKEPVSREVTPLPDDAPSDPRLGQVIQERYRILRLLGEGGMGAVYEAQHLLIRRRVAVKLLHPELARHPEVVTRFRNEAIAATSIGHPHIVEVTDMGRLDDGSFFMVLEYLEGCDLEDVIEREGPLRIARTVHVLGQVCDALEAAHTKGIVHRDLKPENIYLVERGGQRDFVKLLDFGIAKLMGQGDHSLTRTGLTLGTPYFMAPEQAAGAKNVDHRVDIYALGVILFRCLTAEFPFDDEAFPMLVVKICHEPPPPLRTYRPDVPEELAAVCERMLAKDPAERFSSAADVKAALLPFAEFDAPPVVNSEAPPPGSLPATARPERRKGTVGEAAVSLPTSKSGALLLAALAVIAVTVAVVAVVVSRDPSPASETVAPAPAGSDEASVRGLQSDPSSTEETSNRLAETVHLRVEAVPSEAKLRLDGEVVTNPFEADLPALERPRHVEARLDGYRTDVRELPGGLTQRVRIELVPEREAAEFPARAGTGGRRNGAAAGRGQRAVGSGAAESAVAQPEAAPAEPRTEREAERPVEAERAGAEGEQTEILPVRF